MNIVIKIYFQFYDGLLIVQFERIFINLIALIRFEILKRLFHALLENVTIPHFTCVRRTYSTNFKRFFDHLLRSSGGKDWKETVLYRFSSRRNGTPSSLCFQDYKPGNAFTVTQSSQKGHENIQRCKDKSNGQAKNKAKQKNDMYI